MQPTTFKKGLTLIELIVVITIITIMTAVVLVNSSDVRSDAYLRTAESKVVNAAKLAHQKALSVEEFKGEFPGYGIKFVVGANKITVYADCEINDNGDSFVNFDDTFSYTSTDGDDQTCGNEDDGDIVFEEEFENGVFIEDLLFTSNHTDIDDTNPTEAYVEYVSPEPTTWISNQVSQFLPVGELHITLKGTSEETATVILTTTGIVYVE